MQIIKAPLIEVHFIIEVHIIQNTAGKSVVIAAYIMMCTVPPAYSGDETPKKDDEEENANAVVVPKGRECSPAHTHSRVIFTRYIGI